LDCAGRAERRRRFRNAAARSIGSGRSVVSTRRKAVSRCACHRSPNWPRAFWTAPAERSGDGAFETEWRIRLVQIRSRRHHTLESGVALRLPPQSKLTEGVLDCAGRAKRRRRFRNGAARSIGSGRSVVTTRSKAVSRYACHRTPKLGEGVFGLRRQSGAATALSIRSGGFDWFGRLRRYHTLESGVALRLPAQSKLASLPEDKLGKDPALSLDPDRGK